MMPDAVPTWLADADPHDERPPADGRRRWLLLTLACLPWALVAFLLIAPSMLGSGSAPPDHDPTDPDRLTEAGSHAADGAAGPSATEPPHDVEGEPDTDGDVSSGSATTNPGTDPAGGGAPPTLLTPGPLDLAELRGRARAEQGPEEAAALAIVVARGWLTGIEPRLDVGAIEPMSTGYAEHLVVESVEQPGPDAAVVTVLAVMLEPDGTGEQLGVRARRIAVPVVWTGSGPRPGGQPWWLPAPSLEAHPPDTTPIDDPVDHLAALEGLARAGFEDVELVSLAATSGWPVLAEVTARTPDGARSAAMVWLRRHLDGYVVAGTTPLAPDPVDDDTQPTATGSAP